MKTPDRTQNERTGRVPAWGGLAILLVTLLTSTACQPPQFNPPLEPTEPATRWLGGKNQLEQVKDGLAATLAFVDAGPASLLFQLEVSNRTGDPVLVTPEQIQLRLDGGGSPALEVSAVDPEVKLQTLARDAAQEDATRATNNTFRGLFLLTDLTDAAVNTRNRTERESREVRQEARETYRDLDRSDRNSDARLARLTASRTFWEGDCLRKTTVDPGQGVRGRVVFHVDTLAAKQVLFRLTVGTTVFDFRFRPTESKVEAREPIRHGPGARPIGSR